MRHRSTILFLLACLLSAVPLMQRNAAQARCAAYGVSTDDNLFGGLFGDSNSACAAIVPSQPAWMGGMRFLALVCFLAAGVTGFSAWRDRRREIDLLRGAGVRVRKEDIPLE